MAMDHRLLAALLDEINGVGPVIDLEAIKQYNARKFQQLTEWETQLANAPPALPVTTMGDIQGNSKASSSRATPSQKKTKVNGKVKSLSTAATQEVSNLQREGMNSQQVFSTHMMYGRKGMTIGQHKAQFDDKNDDGLTFNNTVERELSGGGNGVSAPTQNAPAVRKKRSHEKLNIGADNGLSKVVERGGRKQHKKVKLGKRSDAAEAFSDEEVQHLVRKMPERKRPVLTRAAKSVGRKVNGE